MLIPNCPARYTGVTLVEVLITLSVSAVVLAIGAPAMGQWVRDVEVRSSASSLLSAIQAARVEALSRNATVRLEFTDREGRPGWRLACVQVTMRCPAVIRQEPVNTGTSVRWGAATMADMPQFSSVIAAGKGMPASVQFDAMGAAPAIANGDTIARIDITHVGDANARRRILLIAARGLVRICDPDTPNGHPEHCH
jgi:type IV fimbrial biogenesis protein FimT